MVFYFFLSLINSLRRLVFRAKRIYYVHWLLPASSLAPIEIDYSEKLFCRKLSVENTTEMPIYE